MSSVEEEEEADDVNVAELKRTRPQWQAMAMALSGRFPLITEEDIWKSLEQFAGHLAMASSSLKELSDERSLSPEDRAIRDTIAARKAQLEAATKDFERAVARGKDAHANRLENIVVKLERAITRLEGPRRVKVLVVDDNPGRRAELVETLDWLSYEVPRGLTE